MPMTWNAAFTKNFWPTSTRPAKEKRFGACLRLQQQRAEWQITADHTFVQRLVDSGRITPEEAAVHPRRSVCVTLLLPVGPPRETPHKTALNNCPGDDPLQEGVAAPLGDAVALLLLALTGR